MEILEWKPARSIGRLFFMLAFIFILILFGILLYVTSLNAIESFWILFYVLLALIFIFIVNLYNVEQMRYILSTDSLIIQWGPYRKKIHFTNIQQLMIIPIKSIQGFRLGGIRLPGYSFGTFELPIDGRKKLITLYATNLMSLVVIKVQKNDKTKYYGLTPREPNKFVDELDERRKENKSIL